ncbi:MAG: shikimate kinase [Gammaproteobacteria bacterium]|nr:shikimate kinase [Gammaproteobacteria bacterium]
MKTVLLGNAGAGKSTLSRKLTEAKAAVTLSLDELAFAGGTERRPLEDSVTEAMSFIRANESWIIEGCYSDIIAPLLPFDERLIFLNPGVEACVHHCKARPWEPEKFESSESQGSNLENLIAWVREYESREDEYGLKRHRELFESFQKSKVEYNHPSEYTVV